MDNYSNEEEIEIINISRYYTINDVLNELKENDSLVFYSNKQLYFMKDNILKKTEKGVNDLIWSFSEKVEITTDLLKQKFYKTNITTNKFVSQITINEVPDLLEKDYTLTYLDEDGEYALVIWIEDNCICHYITDSNNTEFFDSDNDEEYFIKLSELLLQSMIKNNGYWFMLDNEK